MKIERNVVIQGDCREALAGMPAGSVHCAATSPPYYNLRDYGTGEWEGGSAGCDHVTDSIRIRNNLAKSANNYDGGNRNPDRRKDKNETIKIAYREVCGKCGARRVDRQIGLEGTPEEYIANLVAVGREIWRVLRDDGVWWLNLGDSYWGSGKWNSTGGESMFGEHVRSQWLDTLKSNNTPNYTLGKHEVLKPKDLVGIPWRAAFALQAAGWWLRSDVIEEVELYCPCGCGHVLEERIWRWSQDRDLIWRKPNPMPESVTDRPTKAHEYVFLLTKSERYFYDAEAIKEPVATATVARARASNNGAARKDRGEAQWQGGLTPGQQDRWYEGVGGDSKRNMRSVWEIATESFPGAHFATFPTELARRCILAGSSERGCCPECGAPWERVVASESYLYRPTTGSDEQKYKQMPSETYAGAGLGESGGHRAVRSKTLGWRPGCGCSGLPIIEDPPARGSKEPQANFEMRMGEWRERWELLRSQYDAGQTRPCVVLDPFGGAGTVGVVCKELKRDYVLIELNGEYCEMARERIANTVKVNGRLRMAVEDKRQITMGF